MGFFLFFFSIKASRIIIFKKTFQTTLTGNHFVDPIGKSLGTTFCQRTAANCIYPSLIHTCWGKMGLDLLSPCLMFRYFFVVHKHLAWKYPQNTHTLICSVCFISRYWPYLWVLLLALKDGLSSEPLLLTWKDALSGWKSWKTWAQGGNCIDQRDSGKTYWKGCLDSVLHSCSPFYWALSRDQISLLSWFRVYFCRTEFVYRWPMSPPVHATFSASPPHSCQTCQAATHIESHVNCFISAFCLKGQKLSLLVGWGRES